MKRLILLLIVLLIYCVTLAQYKVRFIAKENTVIHHDSIYLTGTFNQWDSLANPDYLMKPIGGNEKSIVLDLPAGTIAYKFSRGNWSTVEKEYNGDEVPNRIVTIDKDTTLISSIISWRDRLIIDKKIELAQQKSDTARVGILAGIVSCYVYWDEFYNRDSALFYAQKAIQLQQKIMASNEYKLWIQDGHSTLIIDLQEMLASLMHNLENYPKALEIRFENLKLAEQDKDKFRLVIAMRNITNDYTSMRDYRNAMNYAKLMNSILSTLDCNDPRFNQEQRAAYYIIAHAFYKMQLPDSALFYAKKMNALALKSTWQGSIIFGNLLLADIYSSMGNDVLAFHYYRLVVRDAPNIFAGHLIASAQSGMARLFRKEARLDSALIFARRSLSYFQNNKIKVLSWGENSNSYIAEISPLVADIYKDNNQLDSAYKYLSLSVALKDSLYNLDKIRQFQTLTFNETARRQQLEQQRRIAEQQYKTKIKMFVLILGMVAILIIALILFWNIKQKQKANKMLQIQKKEIESALNELKKTQSQLIQSEKMASLGELTAGIAHEIQNPLNFVNNFSEVNTELIEEAYQEFDKGNISEVKAILNDIKENEQKINHHGKRADAIVKGMLQHSRTSSGQKEPTDINALADKYLRLAYHGLRAKDKSFNAEYKTDFDPNLPKINVIPQDIGRVILNLITNAFYAVNEKQHQAPQPSRNEFGTGSEGGIENPQNQYEPTVTVSTKLIIPPEGGMRGALISVKDNGSGIPADIVEKIFQPFFTTKPSGQGTGLGLSLSYDVVKAHGGEIKVDSEQGEGSEFTIILPCNNLK